jgi:hypothetical protein
LWIFPLTEIGRDGVSGPYMHDKQKFGSCLIVECMRVRCTRLSWRSVHDTLSSRIGLLKWLRAWFLKVARAVVGRLWIFVICSVEADIHEVYMLLEHCRCQGLCKTSIPHTTWSVALTVAVLRGPPTRLEARSARDVDTHLLVVTRPKASFKALMQGAKKP